MPYNGNGGYTRIYNWQFDAAAGIPITASRVDTEDDGFATGLSTAICRDGQSTITANLPMSGFKHTGVANASARNQYLAAGQVQDGGVTYCGTSGGTANAQTITPTPVITAYAAGQQFDFIPVATNTSGTVTVANSGLTARNVKKGIGGAKVILAPGDIIIGIPAKIFDDGTDYILLNPNTYSHGADIVSASTINLDTATGDLVDVTGTTTITAVTLSEGRQCTVRFTGALTLTNGASLVLPGAANITTVAGDFAIFRGYASGVVRCVLYTKAAGVDERGTFTPVLTFVTAGNLSVSYSVQDGVYAKIGRQVTKTVNVVTSAFTFTTASGAVQISGSPFAALTQPAQGALRWRGITKASYTNVIAETQASSGTDTLYACGSAQADAQITAADMPTAGTVVIRYTITHQT